MGGTTLTYVRGQNTSQILFSRTQNVWLAIVSVTLPSTGTWQCQFESEVIATQISATCPIFYGISTSPSSAAFVDTSERSAWPTSTEIIPMLSTALVTVVSAPETLYVIAGIGSGATNCAQFATSSPGASNLFCLKVA